MNKTEIQEFVRPMLEGCTITEVEDFGDIFAIHFINDEYYKSGKIEDLAVGAGPLIYIKATGEIFTTASAQTSEQYVHAYRESGDVFGQLSEKLEIIALPKNMDKKVCVLTIKKVLGTDLQMSKKLVADVSKGIGVQISLKNEWAATVAQGKLKDLGFTTKHLWSTSRK